MFNLSRYFLRAFGLCTGIFCSCGLLAAETDVHFSGFASLAYARTLDRKEGMLNNIATEGEYRDFNTLGLRMDANLYQRVSFAAQLVAYGSKDYEPEFDWIYARFELSPELQLDVGKSRIPMYMYSDFIDVGYAYQWLEPPGTVYVAGRSFFQSINGLKLSYVTAIGDWESELLMFGGQTEEHFISIEGTEEVDLYLNDVGGAAWTLERQWLTLRAVYVQGDITLTGYSSFEQLLAGIHNLGTGINYLVPEVDQAISPVNTAGIEAAVALESDRLKFSAISAGLDFGRIFSILEVTQSLFESNIAANDSIGGYLTVGVRLPYKLTLSGTYGSRRQNPNNGILAEYDVLMADYINNYPLTSANPDPQVQAVLAGVNSGLAQMGGIIDRAVKVGQDKTINEYSMQLRWDFHASAAFKFEYVIQDNDQFSATTYLPEHVKPQAYRVGIDLVF